MWEFAIRPCWSLQRTQGWVHPVNKQRLCLTYAIKTVKEESKFSQPQFMRLKLLKNHQAQAYAKKLCVLVQTPNSIGIVESKLYSCNYSPEQSSSLGYCACQSLSTCFSTLTEPISLHGWKLDAKIYSMHENPSLKWCFVLRFRRGTCSDYLCVSDTSWNVQQEQQRS